MKSKDINAPSKNTWWYRGVFFVARTVALNIAAPFLKIKTKKSDRKASDTSVIVYNHITHFDFANVVRAYPYYSRFIMTDAVLRKPLPRFFVPRLTNIILRRKGKNADEVVDAVNKTIAAGIDVSLAPEGNASINGVTAPIRGRTGRMIKDAGAGLVTVRLWGGYLNRPIWAENPSKGPVFAKVIGIYPKDEISKMSYDEINELIARDLYVNNFDWVRESKIPYDRKNRAECMERVVFICPSCRSMHTLKSEKDTIRCTQCGYSAEVDEYCLFKEGSMFGDLYQWDVWQTNDMISRRQHWIDNPNEPIIEMKDIRLDVVENGLKRTVDDSADLVMTAERLTIKGESADIDTDLKDIISFTPILKDCTGMNLSGTFYQIKSKYPLENRSLRMVLKILREEPLN